MSDPLIKHYREGFSDGLQQVASEQDELLGLSLDFSILKLGNNQTHEESNAKETTWVLMNGDCRITVGDETRTFQRGSLFDEPPSALSLSADAPISIEAKGECEFAVVRAENSQAFEPRWFTPADLTPEYRGKGLVQDACLRNVRLIFDRTVHDKSNIVIGEVINYPGRWSSYPPHHHAQPELYHYRFTEPQGYGHAEVGDDVYKVKQFDTIRIPGGKDHSQTSAPGYGMYYLWMVRHQPGHPYTGFEFTPEHQWTLSEDKQGWAPKDIKL